LCGFEQVDLKRKKKGIGGVKTRRKRGKSHLFYWFFAGKKGKKSFRVLSCPFFVGKPKKKKKKKKNKRSILHANGENLTKKEERWGLDGGSCRIMLQT